MVKQNAPPELFDNSIETPDFYGELCADLAVVKRAPRNEDFNIELWSSTTSPLLTSVNSAKARAGNT